MVQINKAQQQIANIMEEFTQAKPPTPQQVDQYRNARTDLAQQVLTQDGSSEQSPEARLANITNAQSALAEDPFIMDLSPSQTKIREGLQARFTLLQGIVNAGKAKKEAALKSPF